jgi:chromosomal replication initiator protein
LKHGVFRIPFPAPATRREADARCVAARGAGLPYFVAGAENRLAATAIVGFLSSQPTTNLLLLYGPSGSGKTHLAEGLARHLQRQGGDRRVVCTGSGRFAEDYYDALARETLPAWRDDYRAAAVCVIDDVGQLGGRPQVQQELARALDVWEGSSTKVVVTSRQPPKKIPRLLPALADRLAGGLAVPLALPGPQVRLALISEFAAQRGIRLIEDLATTLAAKLPVSAAELLGALVSLEAAAKAAGARIDLARVEAFLRERGEPAHPPLRSIAVQTAKHFGCTLTSLRSASRRKTLVAARGVAMYLARELTPESLTTIGQFFGGRDHTTVLHGCRQTKELLRHDLPTQCAVRRVREAVAQR